MTVDFLMLPGNTSTNVAQAVADHQYSAGWKDFEKLLNLRIHMLWVFNGNLSSDCLCGVVYSITRCCNSTSIQSQLCVYLQALTFIMQRINRVVVSRSVVMIELQILISVRRTQSHKVE